MKGEIQMLVISDFLIAVIFMQTARTFGIFKKFDDDGVPLRNLFCDEMIRQSAHRLCNKYICGLCIYQVWLPQFNKSLLFSYLTRHTTHLHCLIRHFPLIWREQMTEWTVTNSKCMGNDVSGYINMYNTHTITMIFLQILIFLHKCKNILISVLAYININISILLTIFPKNIMEHQYCKDILAKKWLNSIIQVLCMWSHQLFWHNYRFPIFPRVQNFDNNTVVRNMHWKS